MKNDHLKVTTLDLKLYLTDPNIRYSYFLGYQKKKVVYTCGASASVQPL